MNLALQFSGVSGVDYHQVSKNTFPYQKTNLLSFLIH